MFRLAPPTPMLSERDLRNHLQGVDEAIDLPAVEQDEEVGVAVEGRDEDGDGGGVVSEQWPVVSGQWRVAGGDWRNLSGGVRILRCERRVKGEWRVASGE